MRSAVVLTVVLWVVMTCVRVQWVTPDRTVRIEVACGGVFVMHNADGFQRSGITAQSSLAVPFPLPRVVQYNPSLSAGFMPVWWIPLLLWVSVRLTWQLRIMRVVDAGLMLLGLLLAVNGFMASARSQVNPDTIIPLAIGLPFLVLGYKGFRVVARYRRDPSAGSAVMTNIWLTSLAWGLATLFGQTAVLPVVVLVVLASLISWNIRRVRSAADEIEPATTC